MDFVELHTQSYFSFLQASSSPSDLVGRAHSLGYKSLAISDQCALYGAMEFYKECEELGIQAILGSQLQLKNNEQCVLLCENLEGYARLCEIISRARMNCDKGESLSDWNSLAEFSGHWSVLIGGQFSQLGTFLRNGDWESSCRILEKYMHCFDSSKVFIELNRFKQMHDDFIIEMALKLAEFFNIGYIASNHVLYHDQQRARLLDVLYSIEEHRTIYEEGQLRQLNWERYLKSPQEMIELFRDLPKAVINTVKIANRCNLNLDFSAYRFPEFEVPKPHTTHSYLRLLCERGIKRKFKDGRQVAHQRMNEELNLIEVKQLTGYFLVVWDIVQYALRSGIRCQGRGSAANSLVAYLLDITPIDPIKYDLYFGRFLNEKTETSPDIDLDFASTPGTGRPDREQVIQYVYERYGSEHVAMVCTFVTFRIRNAIREVGKVFKIPDNILGRLSKTLKNSRDHDAFNDPEIMADFKEYLNTPRWNHFTQMVKEIRGVPRHLSVHVGGMLISSLPIKRLVPLEPARMNNRVVCQWDKDMVEDAGLVKVDILGLRMLSVLDDACELIQRDGDYLNIDRIPTNDKAVYSMISRADTVGVFQVESRAQMQSLPRTKPSNYEELGIQIAIIRPGPLQGNMVNPYIQRKQGKEPVEYMHPLLEPALKETLGLILFQEQVLKVASLVAGFSAGEAEQLRKAMSRKRSREYMLSIRQKFLEGARANGVSESDATDVYKTLEGFALYGFCKSHAFSFANITYQSAYLRCHFPAYYYAALLNNQPMGFYSSEVLVRDARSLGLEFMNVDIQNSEFNNFVSNKKIQVGFQMVSGMKREYALKIVSERQSRGLFTSLGDAWRRLPPEKGIFESLILAGGFDKFGLERRELLWQLWLLEGRPQTESFAELANYEPSLAGLPASSNWDSLIQELSVMGFSTTKHPMQFIRRGLNSQEVLDSKEFNDLYNRKTYQCYVAGMVVTRQKPPTAKGFGFLTLEDEFGLINVVVSPKMCEKFRIVFRTAAFVMVYGQRETRDGVVNIKATKINEIQL